jgi:hypothetical protein
MIKTLSLFGIVFLLHLVAVFFGFLPGKFSSMIWVDAYVAILFILGILIVNPAFKNGPESFNNRFLIITTMQMMLMMVLILILVYNKVEGVRILGFSSISIFVVLLAIQSYVFIKRLNKK